MLRAPLSSGRLPFGLLLFLSIFAAARADDCEGLPAPSVAVKRFDAPVAVVTRNGYKALDVLGGALARPGQEILGLTRGNAVVQFDTRVSSHLDATGRWECASPQLTLTYGYRPITVYVAREFPEGSCAYNEIYVHEQRHVKAYQDHLAAIEKELAATLRQRFETGAPWRGPAGQAAERVQRELDERWIPYVNRVIDEVESAQRQIDTPEEYERVANACGGEIRNRIR